ncbi:DNA polymerase III subunit [Criblamydia sequanensis]|uniref:DNA polymerase III subunit delta n=1 Tax=Candidatus Criblamydia sequanensis CRIB-18 TaxID=1437425 RepID=A0A090D0Y6_9BACT|nr:DNA polymerase III subunit [Criblamydia sequanensis]CDR35026.1 DNA polymerase III subunit delta' [Criblamydia sequanensis CRIB-18]
MEELFSDIIGNPKAKKYLLNAYRKKALGHCLLFYGASGIGKKLFAEALAALVLSDGGKNKGAITKVKEGNHPDYRLFLPEGKSGMHSIESMRALKDEVNYAPFESEYKVYVIEEAHRMLATSANALLKTFEEPGKKVLFILLTDQKEHILSTIQSRLRTLYFNALIEDEVEEYLIKRKGVEENLAKTLSLVSRGSIGLALKFLKEENHKPYSSLFELLSKKPFSTYGELSKKCQELASFFDKMKEEIGEVVRKEIEQGFQMEELKAKDKLSLEKEIEGGIASQMASTYKHFLEDIVYFFRDQHLLYQGFSSKYLLNRHLKDQKKNSPMKEPPSIGVLQKAAEEAWIGILRGLNLTQVFENLFIKLGFLG